MDTIYRLIKFSRRIQSHRLKFLAALGADILKLRYTSVRFDPVYGCNLRCEMCHFSSPQLSGLPAQKFTREELTRLADLFFPQALQLVIGCAAEPTLSPDLVEIVKLGRTLRVPFIGITTNGQRLQKESIAQLIEAGLDEITISMHGVRKETYERFMPPASYEKLHEVLSLIDSGKQRAQEQHPGKKSTKDPALRINYTVNPDNLQELESFFDVFGKYRVHTLQLRPIADLGETKYTNKDFSPFIKNYAAICKKLRGICKERSIVFMATTLDPSYSKKNTQSLIIPAVIRHITPRTIWKEGFDWKNQTLGQFCKKIGWRRYLLKSALTGASKLSAENRLLSYDVEL